MEFLRSWISNITVIIIFVMLLETVMPNSSMKRYINVVIGLLIIIVVAKPFVIIKDYAEAFESEVAYASSYIEESSISDKSRDISRYQTAKAMEIYEDNIKKRVLEIIEGISPGSSKDISVRLFIDKDHDSNAFGQLKAVEVTLKSHGVRAIEVNKIKIGDKELIKDNKTVINGDKAEYNLNDRQLRRDIVTGISKALGISEAKITVEVLE